MMNAIGCVKQFAEKKSRQSLSHLSERHGSSAYCNATQYDIDDDCQLYQYHRPPTTLIVSNVIQ